MAEENNIPQENNQNVIPEQALEVEENNNHPGNMGLLNAFNQENDEFYTQLVDIENELCHYKDFFEGKVVFCNCDDPYESNFFKYFASNFNFLKLKKLIATCYEGSSIAGEQLMLAGFEDPQQQLGCRVPHKIEITEVKDENGDGAIDLADVEYLIKNKKNVLTRLKGDGDFRSKECIELLKESDIVVTNPPFSLFREYINQLISFKKEFIVIGNTNALTYKEIFRLFKEDKIRTGYTKFNIGMYFFVPDTYERFHMIQDGRRMVRVSTSCWYTNMYVSKHKEILTFYKHYSAEEYPKYDNYDAINVDKYKEIPDDYDGVMGVPITFLDKYNPDQFELLGINAGRDEFEVTPIKRYLNPIQHNRNGTTSNGSKANTRSTLLLKNRPTNMVYYTADNCEYPFSITYARIFIRRKRGTK